MSADVPRRAAFDDLRVGQWVAATSWDETWAGAGFIVGFDQKKGFEVHASAQGRGADEFAFWLQDTDFHHKNATVTILRDAPAPPVTVPRDKWDEMVAAVEADPDAECPIWASARAVIDNADTGADA